MVLYISNVFCHCYQLLNIQWQKLRSLIILLLITSSIWKYWVREYCGDCHNLYYYILLFSPVSHCSCKDHSLPSRVYFYSHCLVTCLQWAEKPYSGDQAKKHSCNFTFPWQTKFGLKSHFIKKGWFRYTKYMKLITFHGYSKLFGMLKSCEKYGISCHRSSNQSSIY